MAQIKITREELKHDEVLETTDKALRWIKAHGSTVLTIVALIFLVYAIAMFIHGRRETTLTDANDLLAEAQQKYSTAQATTQWGTPERAEALAEIVRIADQVIAEYPDTAVARQALFLKGSAYFDMGDDLAGVSAGTGAPNTDESIDVFTLYVTEAETDLERAKGNLALAYSYENLFFLNNQQQALNDAISRYRMMEQDPSTPEFLRVQAMLGQARLHTNSGRTDEAIELYKKVLASPISPKEDDERAEFQEQQFVNSLKSVANQYTAAGTARIKLQSLGFDVASYEKQLRGGAAAEASTVTAQ